MNKLVRSNLFRFFGLLLLQVIVLDKFYLQGLASPYIYILFIILLPVNISRSLALVLAFLLGIGEDMFSNTGAIHAAATVMVAFVRPYVFKILSPALGYEDIVTPSIKKPGVVWFLLYAAILVCVHNLMLFSLEIFSFSHILFAFLKIIMSSAITMVLIIIYEFLFYSAD